MKMKFRISLSPIFLLAILALGSAEMMAATYYSRATGNWSGSVWATTSTGTATTASITSSDSVYIMPTFTVTVDGADVCGRLAIQAPTAARNGITISGSNSLTISSILVMNASATTGDADSIAVGAGTLTVDSIYIGTNATANRHCVITISTGTINTGAISIGGTAANGIITFTGAGNLNISRSVSGTGTFTSSTGTVNYNGTAAQTMGFWTYYNLITSGGSGIKTFTETAASTVGGNLTVGDGTTLSIAGAFAFTVTGTTTIGNGTSGILSITNATGTKTFTGAVTIANGGTLQETAAAVLAFHSDVTINGTLTENGAATDTIYGNLTNNGTFTASTGVHTLSGTAKTITGTISIPSLAVTGTYTNNGTITVATALSGSGTLTNSANYTLNLGGTCSITTLANAGTIGITGTNAITTILANFTNTGIVNANGTGTITGITNNGIVNIQNTGTITALTNNAAGTVNIISLTFTITTLTATAAGNTVNYAGAGQTIKDQAYGGNLGITGSGTKTWTETAARTVGGNLTVGDGTTLSIAGAFAFTVTGTTTIGNGTSGILSITNATGTKTFTGAVTIANGGTLQETAAAVLAFHSDVTINGTLTENGAATDTIYGNLTNNGTFTASTGVHTLSGTAKTITGTISIPSLAVTGTYTNNGTITVATALSGSGTLAQGTNATLNINFTGTPGISTLTAVNTGNTVNYGYTGTQTVFGINYYNLILSGSGAKALQTGTTTINGNLTLNGTVTTALVGGLTISGNLDSIGVGTSFSDSNYTLNIAGNITGIGAISMGSGTINVGGTFSNTGTFTRGTGTVNYKGTSNSQIVRGGITYYNLQISNGNTKLLQGGHDTVSNVLTLNSGIFDINNYNLILSDTAISAITGTYSSSNMIQTSGTGYVQKAGNASGSGINIVYPVGAGGYYNPLNVISFGAGSGPGNLQIKATTANQGVNALSKYWALTVNTYANITTNLNFTYNNAEVHGTQSQYDTWFYNGTSWGLAPGTHTGLGVNPFGTNITTSLSATAISGRWSAGASAPATSVSYYTYQSGNWTDSTSWTTDPSGTLWLNPSIPGDSDNVTILNSRTITMNSNNRHIKTLTINQGGVLDINSTIGHYFGTVSGQGKMMLSSNNLPGGTFTNFVASNGGTIEYDNLNNVSIITSQFTYNNLIISNYTSNVYKTYLDNSANPTSYIINGNFSLKNYSSGSDTLYFGNPTPSDNLINMTVYGNFSVGVGCHIRVNNFAGAHTIPHPTTDTSTLPYPVDSLSLYGNFTNNGSVRFTGLPSTAVNAYYTLGVNTYNGIYYGDVQVIFYGSSNNTLTCNGVTDFYRLVVAKGTDKTYSLEVTSSDTNNFALYAPNDQGNDVFDGQPEGFGYGAYYKALFIHYGTLKLDENIKIPSLTEGGQDFNLLPTAELWVNGAIVSTTVTGVNGTGWQAATLYGTLRVSAGSFSTGDAAGIVLGILGTPVIQIEGTGTLDVSQAWTATAGASNLMSYIQTGGTANFRMQGENHAGPMLGINSANASFVMSGGVMNFTSNVFIGGGTDTLIMDIESKVGNYQITGGTVNFNLPSSATSYTAISTVPFYNLVITKGTVTGAMTSIRWNANTLGSGLSVLNDLTINDSTVLNMQTNSIDLSVGHNFTITTRGIYSPATGAANSTSFNGASSQAFYNIGTITGGALNNLTITNSSNTTIMSNNLTVKRILTIGQNAVLNDSGKFIYADSNIVNAGTHIGLSTRGGIRMQGTSAQTIDGNGTFNNLFINKSNTTGVSLINNTKITGALELVQNPNLTIGSYNLTLDTAAKVYTDSLFTAQSYDSTHMIVTSGLASDNGVTKKFSSTNKSFLFPFGTGTKYRPAQIQFTTAPTQYGSITIRPVLTAHPLIQASGKAINLYWKMTSSGFLGILNNSINQVYNYYPYDVPNSSDEVNYIPATYIPPVWDTINNVAAVIETTTPRQILFNSVNYLDGEYTCGTAAAFGAIPTYYSNTYNINVQTSGADWNAAYTWCTDVNRSNPVTTGLKDTLSNAIFIIGDGGSSGFTHTINITGSHHIQAGNISIQSNAVLDIGTSTGHNFGALQNTKVTGNGMLKIASTRYFPTGDWGAFLGTSGGTVEYYQTTSNNFLRIPSTYMLPVGSTIAISSYRNLIIAPNSNSTITLPDSNLTIYNNLIIGDTIVGGTSNCIAQLDSGSTSRTVEVKGVININKYGILQYTNTVAQNLVADSDLIIATGGTLQVWNGGNVVANTLTVKGNVVNNGTLDLDPGLLDTYKCALIFSGTSSKTLSSTSTPALSRFYGFTVNKGTTRDSIVEVTIDPTGFTMGGGGLSLQNGTFRLTSWVTIVLSTAGFTIPTTGCLSANGGNFYLTTSTTSADLSLNGRLEVQGGSVIVGPSFNSGISSSYNIIYAPAGTPEIIVSGAGLLRVYSQIRRGSANTAGSLNYTQTGGNVEIGGKSADSTRAVFEVLNGGSKFVMSGGYLLIANAIHTTSPFDLYLEPDVENVTGGTIWFGYSQSVTTSNVFRFKSSCSIGNITLEASSNASAIQQVYELTLLGSLTIGGPSGYYSANGLNVTIGGNFTNKNTSTASNSLNVGGFQAVTAGQSTAFIGTSDQIVAGTTSNITNFANLEVATAAGHTLYLSNTVCNIAIHGDLTLTSGTLVDSSNSIYLFGNVNNNAVHVSPDTTKGGMVFIGTVNQGITGSGYGIFGNIQINNGGNGVNMTDNSTINGQIKLTNGYLYIDNYLLTLGSNAFISGSLNATNLILLNGVLSDEGVKKTFPAGAGSFTFPVGDNGKYTPCSYNFKSNNNVGATIKVVTVDQLHPSINPALYKNYLNYYWNVVSAGFISSYLDSVTFTYIPDDTVGNPANIERCDNSSQWTKVSGTISCPTFSFVSDSLLDGGYTIGDQFNSLRLFTSKKSGNWNDTTVWDTTSIPNGNPVIIRSSDSIALSANGAYAASVVINGVLDAKNTTFHNIGHVSGAGKIRLLGTSNGSFVFPGGSFDAFFANTASTIEFYGSTNGTLPSGLGDIYKPFQNVILSGTGTKYINGVNMQINGNLIFSPSSILDNTQNNKDLIILGNWIDQNTTAAGFNAGTGTVYFNGSTAQSIVMANSSMKEVFNNLAINNTAGLTLNTGNVDVNNQLILTSGNINTSSSNNLTINNTGTNAVAGGSINSFVNGPLRKKMSNNSSFTFPVGDANSSSRNRYGYVSVNVTAPAGTQIWTVQFVDKNPSNDGYNTANFVAPLNLVFSNEYWNIAAPTGGNANVVLSYDKYTGMSGLVSERIQSNVTQWNTPTLGYWNSDGGSVTDFNQDSGTVATPTPASFNSNIFAIGATGLKALITAIQSGLWSTASIWDIGRVPGQSDTVVINNSIVVKLNPATVSIAKLVLNSGGTFFDSTNTLTITGNFIFNGYWSGQGKISLTTANDTIYGSGSMTGTSILEIAGSSKTIASTANLTLKKVSILSGDTLYNNGTVAIDSVTGSAVNSSFNNQAGSTLTINGPLLITGTLIASTCPNTIIYDGTIAQTINPATYCNLTLTGVGIKTAAGSSIVNNNLIINFGSNLSINSSVIVQVQGRTYLAGALTNYGNLLISN